MKASQIKKASVLLGLASVATSAGNIAVKAGPALQTLNNLTNTSEFTINNTYGQSFSVDGIVTADTDPFAFLTAAGVAANFNAGSAVLTTGFLGGGMGGTLQPTSTVQARATIATLATAGIVILNASGLAGLSLVGATGTQTLGASISSTLFGPSTVKATSSFTNQLINDLSAF